MDASTRVSRGRARKVHAAPSTVTRHSLPTCVAAILALTRICVTFELPSRQVFFYELVGPEILPNAIALNSGLFNATRVLGPALAGVCLTYAPSANATRISAGAYSLPAGNPVVSGSAISSSWANSTLADLSQEITNSLDRQGRGPMLAPLTRPARTCVPGPM